MEKLLVWVPQLQVKMRDGGRAIEFSDVTQFLYSQWRVALDDEAMLDVKVQAGQWSLDAIAAQLAVLHSAQPDRSPVGLTRALIIAEDALARLDEAALEKSETGKALKLLCEQDMVRFKSLQEA